MMIGEDIAQRAERNHTMRQKTFVLDYHTRFTPTVGDEAILVCRTDTINGCEKWSLFKGDGVPGNMNSNVKRYHGWRGTTGKTSVDAFGMRRIEKVTRTKDGEIKVTVGRDLHPDWE